MDTAARTGMNMNMGTDKACSVRQAILHSQPRGRLEPHPRLRTSLTTCTRCRCMPHPPHRQASIMLLLLLQLQSQERLARTFIHREQHHHQQDTVTLHLQHMQQLQQVLEPVTGALPPPALLPRPPVEFYRTLPTSPQVCQATGPGRVG